MAAVKDGIARGPDRRKDQQRGDVASAYTGPERRMADRRRSERRVID